MQLRILFYAAIAGAVLTSGCATVTANDGERVTLEHDFFASGEAVRSRAVRACEQNGKTGAELVHSANKNPSLPRGKGAQLSTFRCL